VEIEGFKQCMLRDGVAYVRFWRWLEQELTAGHSLDEWQLGMRLAAFRKEEKNCYGESFETIVAYGSNGAIVHYSASPESKSQVKLNDILLIDHGGQYLEATTDMTRTHSLYYSKKVPESYMQDYAAVLKGNIALAESVFPEGTRGCQLDVLARQFLWARGEQFGHGTSHGIGH